MTRHTPPTLMPVRPVTDVRLGSPKLYANSVGDTWDPAWAADGSLVFPGNDGSGWDGACGNNVFFSRAVGDDPLQLVGTTVNCMPEYGGWAEKGPDGATWKSSGCISLDGVLYFGVARHTYGTHSGDPFRRQTAKRASLIKSIDGGRTWTRPAQENYDAPMFATGRFATPYFIHYDQDGAAPAVDNAEAYIYATSNNGFWCNGDNYVLGRVERAKLGRLDASDWSFYTGGDGMDDNAWSADSDQAALIIDNPLKCGETGATYIDALGRYLLVAWSYPGDPNVETDETRLIFYEAPHPWGPWNAVKEAVSRPEGWYCPRILAKWQQGEGREVAAVMVTGGDYYEMSKYYRFTVVPLEMRAGGAYPPPPPPPETRLVNDGAAGTGLFEIEYRGTWKQDRSREKAHGGSEHLSAVEGDTFLLRFEGRRLRWHASKENSFGIASVSLDGDAGVPVDLYTYCVEPQMGRLLYDSGDLSPGEHLFEVRVTGQKNASSSGYTISNDRIVITV
jgi:hypothetical protein